MIERLTDDEIDFLEDFYYPIAQAECLFSDFDNLTAMEDNILSHVRLGQYLLFSYEYLLDYDPTLSNNPNDCDKFNFQLRKNVGDCYCLGGRLFGKTLVEKLDLLISVNLLEAERCGFTSYDALHIRGVLEEIVQVLDHHPFFRIYKAQITRNPNYRFYFPTGYLMESVNMNLSGKSPGGSFFQKHFTRLYIEEASLETEAIYQKRRDSVAENGCVFRVSGMTNFTKYSPAGKVFYDLSQKNKVLNYPQYINPKWDSKAKEKAVKDFGGEQSIGFRVFIKGEVVEEGVSVFDMERVRKFYDDKRFTKTFEISKLLFNDFDRIIIVEKPVNATETYIFADIGESAPTEIGINFKIGEKYRYVYNIILYGLTDKEQFKILRWLATELNANYIAIDTTDGTGRAIFRSLGEVFPNKNLIWVAFNEKIAVDFEKDDKGALIIENGKPVHKEEYISIWSVKRLKDLLYGGFLDLPTDYKLDQQLNSVVSMQSGTRTIYQCVSQQDHIFQAFQVFAIAEWMCYFSLIRPIGNKKFCKSGV